MIDTRERQNGAHRQGGGRTPPPLPSFTFPTSGITVQIRRLGPFTSDELTKAVIRQHPRPQPPMNRVEIGGEVRDEPNDADPDYVTSLAAWERAVRSHASEKLFDLVVNYSVVCEIDADAVEQARLMLQMIDSSAVTDASDRAVYVKHVCILSQEDVTKLLAFVTSQSQPTEEAVQAHVETFPGDV